MQWLSRAVLAAALLGSAVPKALAENDTQSRACANDTDMAAFRTAAVQQQLMVAALTCKDVEVYNRFVLAYQPELEKSDADLKAYFARRGHVAEYDTFKTKLANLSSLSTIANGPAYCENAAAAFDVALKSRQSLSSFVADQRLMIAMPQQTVCSAPKVQMAAARPAPVPAAATKLAPLQVIAVRNAPVKPVPEPEAAPPVRLAAAAPPRAVRQETREDSMPANEAPAVVAEARPARQVYDQVAYNRAPVDEDELPLPPRPHTREALRLEAYYAAQYARAPHWGADPYGYPGR